MRCTPEGTQYCTQYLEEYTQHKRREEVNRAKVKKGKERGENRCCRNPPGIGHEEERIFRLFSTTRFQDELRIHKPASSASHSSRLPCSHIPNLDLPPCPFVAS